VTGATESSTWPRLFAARASYLLAAVDVDHVTLKGPSHIVRLGLRPDRVSVDIDVLVNRADLPRAVAVLTMAGFTPRFDGTAPGEVAEHSVVLRSPSGPEVDLHTTYPGLDLELPGAWDILRSRIEPVELAHKAVPALETAGCALIAALGAARDGPGSRAAHELAGLVASVPRAQWEDTAGLARELGAGGPLRAALELTEEGAALATALRLPEPDAEWRLRSRGAPAPALRLEQVLRTHGRARWHLLAREVLPTRAFMTIDYPKAAHGLLPLAIAHLRRWGRLARAMPRNVAAVRRAQKSR
jgi:hypothetical protein